MRCVSVVIKLPLDKPFTYTVPDKLSGEISVVPVLFNKRLSLFPKGVDPGSWIRIASIDGFCNFLNSTFACRLLPLPSFPSNVMNNDLALPGFIITTINHR